jgi:tetraacyldisaccharide 4'-kinase
VGYRGFAERVFKLIVSKEKRSIGLSFLRLIATVLSWPYSGLVALRNGLFDTGRLRSRRFDCVVLSVGNLTTGGTGKTPMVLWLAQFLSEQGRRVVVVSRGYRGESRGPVLVASDGDGILADSDLTGDEPQLLARRLPQVPVVCSPRRVLGVQTALERFRAEVVILDDGFQHRYVARDLDIVLLDARIPMGNGRILPRGPLREGISALHRAHALVLTRFDGSSLACENRRRLARDWPETVVFKTRHSPVRLFETTTGRERPLGSVAKLRTAAFAGICRPDDFFQTLVDLGAKLVYTKALPNHYPISRELLQTMVREAGDLQPEIWVTTEKDWVRLPDSVVEGMGIWVLTIGLDFEADESGFEMSVLKVVQRGKGG